MTQERHRLRRTKIVATLGPATDKPEVLDRMVRAGLDVVRVNFSHGEAADHVRRVEAVRQAARNAGREVAVLADLQGPKIRTDRFSEGKVFLDEGARFVLDANWPANAGNQERVGITYKELPNDVVVGDNLLLDDGKIVLEVLEISGGEIICRVLVGGELSNNKGINRLGGGLSAAAITDKDRADIKVAAAIAADYVAVSFPRNAADINEARDLLRTAGGHGAIVAKIERAESLAGVEDIIAATDVVMIAQGGGVLRAIAPSLAFNGLDPSKVKLLGTGLWDDPSVLKEQALTGGWFAAPEPNADNAFNEKYRAVYGAAPPQLASLAYDAVTLVALLSNGTPYHRFTPAALMDPNGFGGVNGIFRFNADGTSERGLAVLEVQADGFHVASPAPKTFQANSF